MRSKPQFTQSSSAQTWAHRASADRTIICERDSPAEVGVMVQGMSQTPGAPACDESLLPERSSPVSKPLQKSSDCQGPEAQ
jgi:methionyl-tRNA formyltransferase